MTILKEDRRKASVVPLRNLLLRPFPLILLYPEANYLSHALSGSSDLLSFIFKVENTITFLKTNQINHRCFWKSAVFAASVACKFFYAQFLFKTDFKINFDFLLHIQILIPTYTVAKIILFLDFCKTNCLFSNIFFLLTLTYGNNFSSFIRLASMGRYFKFADLSAVRKLFSQTQNAKICRK